MMIKIAVLAVIVLGSFGLGEVLVKGNMREIDITSELIRCINSAKLSMISRGQSLKEAFALVPAKELKPFFTAAVRAIIDYPSFSGKDIFKTASAKSSLKDFLPAEVLFMFERLMKGLCSAVTTEEVELLCDAFLKEAKDHLESAKEAHKKKGKTVKSLCFLSGLIIAIILV